MEDRLFDGYEDPNHHPALLAETSMTEFNPSFDTPPPAAPRPTRLSFSRRAAASALLIVGLFAVGGTAVVMAADPSASPAPSTTTQPSTGGSGTSPSTGTNPGTGGTTNPSGRPNHANGQDCPNMGTGSGSGGSGGSGGSSGTQTAPTTPTTPDASAAPAV